MSVQHIWIVTPVFLDVEPFLKLRDRVRDVFKDHSALSACSVSFVVLDDSAGRDKTMDQIRELDDVTVIEPPFQLGHQRAIVYALRTVVAWITDEDVVVTMDSDGEDRPEDLPRLLEHLSEDEIEHRVVLAQRTRRRTTLRFKLLYVGFSILFRLLTGTRVRSGNYAAYAGPVAKRLLMHPLFDLSYSSTLTALDLPTRYVPCERGERYGGESRMGYGKLVMHGLGMLTPFVDRIATRALIVFALTFALAAALGVTVVAVRLLTDAAIPGWATYTLLSTLILSLVSLGNFVTLFMVFSQTRARWLANIEQFQDDGSLVAPTVAD